MNNFPSGREESGWWGRIREGEGNFFFHSVSKKTIMEKPRKRVKILTLKMVRMNLKN